MLIEREEELPTSHLDLTDPVPDWLREATRGIVTGRIPTITMNSLLSLDGYRMAAVLDGIIFAWCPIYGGQAGWLLVSVFDVDRDKAIQDARDRKDPSSPYE